MPTLTSTVAISSVVAATYSAPSTQKARYSRFQSCSFHLSIYLSSYLSLYLSIYLHNYQFVLGFHHCNIPGRHQACVSNWLPRYLMMHSARFLVGDDRPCYAWVARSSEAGTMEMDRLCLNAAWPKLWTSTSPKTPHCRAFGFERPQITGF